MGDMPIIFKPLVDPFDSDPIMPKDPYDVLIAGDLSNKVPLILGHNKHEGLMLTLPLFQNQTLVDMVNGNLEDALNLILLHRYLIRK